MALFTIENLTFSYPEKEYAALCDISFSLEQGSFNLLIGTSGCGKSTLLRHFKTVLCPHGQKEGQIFYKGIPLEAVDEKTQAARIGFVLQNPDSQIVTDKVWHELAFGLESLSESTEKIRLRVAEMASFFGIEDWFYKNVTDLSGGQKQLLNLASVMTMQPEILILDEPTSQLDPIAASEFLQAVVKINRELGVTVLMTEQRLEEVLPISDRVICMRDGRIVADGKPRQVCRSISKHGFGMFESLPCPVRVYASVKNPLECPITVREGKVWLDEVSKTTTFDASRIKDVPHNCGEPVICMKNVYFRYHKDAPDVVRGLSLTVRSGELFAIVGSNGAGKSTTLGMIMNFLRPYRGKVTCADKKISMLPQNPQALFVKNTLKKDLMEATDSNLSKSEREAEVLKMAKLVQLDSLLDVHPYDLSGGEQQRAALAKVLIKKPDILLLDEPTKGLDGRLKIVLAEIFKALCASGVTIVMVSHDIEFCAEYAHVCAMMFDGQIVSQGAPRQFFAGNNFYTTAANRMARGKTEKAVTANDIIAALGEEPFLPPNEPDNKEKLKAVNKPQKCQSAPKKDTKISKRTWVAIALILFLIPATIAVGILKFSDRNYYFISFLIVIYAMIPFFLVFENKKPKARELIIIAVLAAIGVAGRAAFYMVPQFKPLSAIVIISGISFGAEAGFLVGAMSAFVSNFFFGQGPWTPWQMFCFGIIGFLAGLLFKKGLLKRRTVDITVFGVLAVLIIYGGIINPSSLFMYGQQLTGEAILASYVRGFPFDILHAASTGVFLFFTARPMIEKLDRIKLKYGLIET